MSGNAAFHYIAVMEAQDGKRGSSRVVLAISDPDTVAAVIRVIRERMEVAAATRDQPSGLTASGRNRTQHDA